MLSHARALLSGTPAGACDYLDADLRDTSTVLRAAAATLDFGQPVALMLLIILHLISDADDPYGIVARLVTALPVGSYLVLAHPASDIRAVQMAEMTKRVNQRMGGPRATMREPGCGRALLRWARTARPGRGPASALAARAGHV